MTIPVLTGETASGIDASLEAASSIAGVVTEASGTVHLVDINVTAYSYTGADWNWTASDSTDALGRYRIGGLTAGTYRVEFQDTFNGIYVSEVYSNAADLSSGQDITLPAMTHTTGIDADLARAARISGTVTGPNGQTPVQAVNVTPYRYDGSNWQWQANGAWTGADGRYTIGRLNAGTYRVDFWDSSRYHLPEVFSNATAVAWGTDIPVAAGDHAQGIDASLLPILAAAAEAVDVQPAAENSFAVHYTGFSNMTYILQEAPSPTGVWQDVGDY